MLWKSSVYSENHIKKRPLAWAFFSTKIIFEKKNEKSQKMRIKLDKIRSFATKKRENDAPSYLFLVEFEFNIVLLFVQY